MNGLSFFSFFFSKEMKVLRSAAGIRETIGRFSGDELSRAQALWLCPSERTIFICILFLFFFS
ncbi:hypothetical protein LguiB_020489 [Lonicera macranthoides]